MNPPEENNNRTQALPTLQEALKILEEQLRLPDWVADAPRQPSFEQHRSLHPKLSALDESANTPHPA
jgi:hypothetical protein